MTLQTLLNIASELGIRENLVNYCANGPSVYALNPEEIENYPLFFLSPTGNNVAGKTQTRYNITVYYMDRLLEDGSNETQIDSVAIESLRNFLKQLENEDGIVEITEPSIRLFTTSEKMLDRVAGAYTTVDITTLNNTNCEVYYGSNRNSKDYDAEIRALSASTNENSEKIGLLSAETAENLEKIGALSAITDSLDSKIMELSGETSENASKIAQISALTESCCTSVHRDIESLSAGTESAVSGISQNISQLSSSTAVNSDAISALSGQVSGQGVHISSLERDIQTISGRTDSIGRGLADLSAYTETIDLSPYATTAQTQQIEDNLSALSASTQSLETAVASKGNVASTTINNIITLTQAEYDAITPAADALYFITD